MIKILILAVLLFYVMRVIGRILTYPARMNHENQGSVSQNPKEKDISDKGRTL